MVYPSFEELDDNDRLQCAEEMRTTDQIQEEE